MVTVASEIVGGSGVIDLATGAVDTFGEVSGFLTTFGFILGETCSFCSGGATSCLSSLGTGLGDFATVAAGIMATFSLAFSTGGGVGLTGGEAGVL